MKLVFNKDENDSITVQFQDDSGTQTFSYSEMVKKIYNDRVIEDPVINGNFTDIERNSINELIRLLRESSEIDGEMENVDND